MGKIAQYVDGLFIDKSQRDDFFSFLKGMLLLGLWAACLFATSYISTWYLKQVAQQL